MNVFRLIKNNKKKKKNNFLLFLNYIFNVDFNLYFHIKMMMFSQLFINLNIILSKVQV
jgi:hypothetical protein